MPDQQPNPVAGRGAGPRENPAVPRIPGTSGFVPVHAIFDASALVLALALHRDAAGNPRPGLSSRLLAAALRDGEVACDPIAVAWMPALQAADAAMSGAWGAATGHEGESHRHLRAAAAGLLAAWAPLGARIEAERPRRGRGGRSLRPDLQVRAGARVLVAEVGVAEGDAVAALLLPGPRPGPGRADPPATHVAVLPFAGRRAASARGYVFRRAGAPPLATPTRARLRAAWADFVRRAGDAAPLRGQGT